MKINLSAKIRQEFVPVYIPLWEKRDPDEIQDLTVS